MLRFQRLFIYLLVLIFSFSCKSLIAQDKKICLFDTVANEVISDAFIYSYNYNTISDRNGLFEIPNGLKSYKFLISHINYELDEVDFSEIYTGDTLFLAPVNNIIEEVVITGKRKKQNFDWLYELLKSYREKEESENLGFTFILKSRLDDQIVENLQAEIDLEYSVGEESIFQNFYANSGFFWFDPEAPFLNLQTERLIFSLDPFHSNRNNLKLITARKNKKDDFASYDVCNNCSKDQVKINIQSKDKNQVASLVIDTSVMIINQANYSISDCRDARLYGISDGNRLQVNSINLNYQFDSIGFPTMIRSQFEMEKDSSEVIVNCLLVKKKPTLNQDSSLIVLGNPNFDNLYEQILFNPEVTSDLSSEIEENILKDTVQLSSFNPALRKPFLESNFSAKRLKLLSQYYRSLPLDLIYITKDSYVDVYGKKKGFNSVLRVYQPLRLEEKDDGYALFSTYPIIDLTNSRIYTASEDPFYNQIVLMLFAYKYEVDRQKYMSDIENINSLDKDQIATQLKLRFEERAQSYNSEMTKFFKNESDLTELLVMNNEIEESLGFNVINSVLMNDYPCEACKEELLSEIIRLGYRTQKEKPDFSKLCFQQSLSVFYLFLNQLKENESGNKEVKGSYFSRMAELYIELDDMENACKCLEKYKLYWSNGFMESGKKNYYFENCPY